MNPHFGKPKSGVTFCKTEPMSNVEHSCYVVSNLVFHRFPIGWVAVNRRVAGSSPTLGAYLFSSIYKQNKLMNTGGSQARVIESQNATAPQSFNSSRVHSRENYDEWSQ